MEIDKLLVDAARVSGADVAFRTRLVDLVRAPDDRVCGAHLRDANGRDFQVAATLVVGADGAQSTVADLVGATHYKTGHHATGVVFSYWAGTGLEGYHWYFRPGRGVGAIATNDGLTCVFVSVPQSRFHEELRHDMAAGHQRVLMECERNLASVVENAQRAERYRGFVGPRRFFRQSCGPGWGIVKLSRIGLTDAQHARFTTGLEPIILEVGQASFR